MHTIVYASKQKSQRPFHTSAMKRIEVLIRCASYECTSGGAWSECTLGVDCVGEKAKCMIIHLYHAAIKHQKLAGWTVTETLPLIAVSREGNARNIKLIRWWETITWEYRRVASVDMLWRDFKAHPVRNKSDAIYYGRTINTVDALFHYWLTEGSQVVTTKLEECAGVRVIQLSAWTTFVNCIHAWNCTFRLASHACAHTLAATSSPVAAIVALKTLAKPPSPRKSSSSSYVKSRLATRYCESPSIKEAQSAGGDSYQPCSVRMR